MPEATVPFLQIASFITSTVAELLYAPVIVTNDEGTVITSSKPGLEELPWYWPSSHFLRLPLRHKAETGEIIVGEPVQRESVSPKLAQALVEVVINQATNSYYQLPSQQKLKNQLICDLLYNEIKDKAALVSRAKYLKIDLTPPRAVILIDATDYILCDRIFQKTELPQVEQLQRSQFIINSIVSFFCLPNDAICADLGQGKVCVLKASDTKNLDPWVEHKDNSSTVSSSWANLTALKRAAKALLLQLQNETKAAISIGIGRYHPGIRGLALSYEDARAALFLGNQFHHCNQVHCLDELGMAAFVGVADERTKIDLAKYLLSPLDHEPELLKTLSVFFSENCCPSTTAKQLSIHRNTLSYRFEKISSLTGLEPRKFEDAVQMRLCLLLRSLQLFNGNG